MPLSRKFFTFEGTRASTTPKNSLAYVHFLNHVIISWGLLCKRAPMRLARRHYASLSILWLSLTPLGSDKEKRSPQTDSIPVNLEEIGVTQHLTFRQLGNDLHRVRNRDRRRKARQGEEREEYGSTERAYLLFFQNKRTVS